MIVPPDVAALGGRNRLFIGLKYAVLGGTFCIMFFMTVAWGTRIFCRVSVARGAWRAPSCVLVYALAHPQHDWCCGCCCCFQVERTFSGDDFKARRGSSFATRG